MQKLKTILATSTIVVLSLCIALMSGCSITAINSGSSSTSTESSKAQSAVYGTVATNSVSTVSNTSDATETSEASSANETYSITDISQYQKELVGPEFVDLNHYTPCTGTVYILVIPIEFADKQFTPEQWTKVQKTMNGNGVADTGYWESLASFYAKSSYGALNFQFMYADAVNMGMTTLEFYNQYVNDERALTLKAGIGLALDKGVNAYKEKVKDEIKKFDSNGDGYLDGVIMVYPEDMPPDFANIDRTELPSYVRTQALYWAFKGWTNNTNTNGYYTKPKPNVDDPVAYDYSWFSYSTIEATEGVLDPHTLIHEVGHMLGPRDFYNQTKDTDHLDENPSGSKHMMANNVLDHDAVSKMMYNWVSPYYVNTTDVADNASIYVQINSHESTGDVLILADPNGWNGSAYDEYIAIELFTPTGLNEHDSKIRYSDFGAGTVDSGYNNAGIRIWHVDNRLNVYNTSITGNVGGYSYISDADISNGGWRTIVDSNSNEVTVAASNNYTNASKLAQQGNYKQLALISVERKNYINTNYRNLLNKYSTDADLFHAGDVFSLSTTEQHTWTTLWDSTTAQTKNEETTTTFSNFYTQSGYFANGASGKFNNGNVFPWKVEIISIDDMTATIKLTKTATTTTTTVAEETSEYVENEESTWADIDVISVDIGSDSLDNAKKEDVTID